MTESNERDVFTKQDESENSIFSLQAIWVMFLQNWYWVLASVLVCLIISVVYLRYKTPVYAASMKVLIKDADQRGRAFSGMNLEELGMVSNSNGFDNELEILRSSTVSTRVVKRLKLYVTYFMEGRFVNRELYKNSPVLVDLEESRLDALDSLIYLVVTKTGHGIHVDGYLDAALRKKQVINQDIQTLPATVQTSKGILIFQPNALAENDSKEWKDGSRMRVTIYPPKIMGGAYSASRLTTAPLSKVTTIAKVGITDTKPRRALDFLGELLNCYNEDANEDKNEVAKKTEEFISDRLNSIKKELDETEVSMEVYKKDNELINLANDATTALTGSTGYRKELVEIQTQMSLLKSLMEYMDTPANYLQIIPANLGLQVSKLPDVIARYNEAVLKRNRLLKSSSEENPLVVQLTRYITDIWPTIRQDMTNIYRDMETQKGSIAKQLEHYSSRLNKTPTQERILTNIVRTQTVQAELYLTLLQKREANYIQLYSTAAKARIIGDADITGKVSPNNRSVLFGGLVIGVCFPLALLMAISFFRFRINGREDVERLTKLPILADIPAVERADTEHLAVVIRENHNGMMEEAFRGLRTNMRFVLKPNEKVVLVTSCIPHEGKSFVAANLSMSLALLGKKVIIVGLDIRKPRLVSLFGLKTGKQGIVNFLCGSEADYELLDRQIISSGINANMDVLPAGIIPPNPAELLSSPLLDKAVEYLSSKYDYVILDTPPVGIVADTLILGHVANATLFVARADYSYKANFELINDIHNNQKLPNCNIIVNAVNMKRKHRYGYSYSYAYGTGHYGHYGSYGNYGQHEDSGKYHVEK
ncbi:MAG: polysaccharide biosynthesis tyrosine autokinase [Bacteroidaceae bacterium]|nr:polysaccharide biosynthesis tyrosine autokinase [Bacteroidaceae bacterium]